MEKRISSSEAHVLADHQDSQILDDTAAPRLDDRNSSFCFILLLVIKNKINKLTTPRSCTPHVLPMVQNVDVCL
jgi:hypothetical protein